jgi:hypothetical protein
MDGRGAAGREAAWTGLAPARASGFIQRPESGQVDLVIWVIATSELTCHDYREHFLRSRDRAVQAGGLRPGARLGPGHLHAVATRGALAAAYHEAGNLPPPAKTRPASCELSC